MDGAQDMGGMQGYGPVMLEPDEPLFHAEWERRAFALTLAMARPGGWTIDMSRYARENRSPQDYLGKSYYELWLAGLERLMTDRELIGRDEIEAGQMLHPPKPVTALKAADVAPMLRLGGPADRRSREPGPLSCRRPRPRQDHRFGDPHAAAALRSRACRHDRTREWRARLPGQQRAGEGENPQWLYTVSFDSRELWGTKASSISIA